LYGTGVALAGSGVAAVRRLFAGPYHGIAMLGPLLDVGMSAQSYTPPGQATTYVGYWAEMSTPGGKVTTGGPGKQLLAGSDVATYPCEGSTGLSFKLSNETPEPVVGRDLSVNPFGHPVYIMLREGHTLAITKVAMTVDASGVNIPLRDAVTGTNDRLRGCVLGCFLSHQGYVIPDAPLKPNTKYHVTLSGTNNEVAFTRDFSFLTGNSDY